jgi:hypothetical protein
MKLDQHHADIYVMLQMQRRLIAALQDALVGGTSDDWIERTIMLIAEAEFRTDFLKITDRSGYENQTR